MDATDVNVTSDVVLPDSAQAAHLQTVTGWVSRHGKFFGKDERAARWDGATHTRCQCGGNAQKPYTACETCRSKRARERYFALEQVEWDGKTPLFLWDGDEFFESADYVYDYADENGISVTELMLVIAEPNTAALIDPAHWADQLPEGVYDLPPWLDKLIDETNKAIAAHRSEPLSWSPGKRRTALPEQRQESM